MPQKSNHYLKDKQTHSFVDLLYTYRNSEHFRRIANSQNNIKQILVDNNKILCIVKEEGFKVFEAIIIQKIFFRQKTKHFKCL